MKQRRKLGANMLLYATSPLYRISPNPIGVHLQKVFHPVISSHRVVYRLDLSKEFNYVTHKSISYESVCNSFIPLN